jgi:hypothetical protein
MRFQKLMWRNIMTSTKSQKVSILHYSIDLNSNIDKETLRIGFRKDPTFWFKKITKKVFIIR